MKRKILLIAGIVAAALIFVFVIVPFIPFESDSEFDARYWNNYLNSRNNALPLRINAAFQGASTDSTVPSIIITNDPSANTNVPDTAAASTP